MLNNEERHVANQLNTRRCEKELLQDRKDCLIILLWNCSWRGITLLSVTTRAGYVKQHQDVIDEILWEHNAAFKKPIVLWSCLFCWTSFWDSYMLQLKTI